MAAKILLLLALAVVGSQAVTEILLPDVTTSHISSDWHPKSIGIGILFLDNLVSCHVIFPSGLMYELFPTAQALPHASMINGAQNGVFPSCGMSFRNAPESLSGTYEVLSLVQHTDSSRTLSRQKNHITFIATDLTFPKQVKDFVHAEEEVKKN